MDESVLDTSAMDTSTMSSGGLGEPAPELEGYADVASLEEGQQVMLQLPAGERTGTESVIMQVVRVDGNQIHFITPDTGAHDPDENEVKAKDSSEMLQLSEDTEFENPGAESTQFEGPSEAENAEFDDSDVKDLDITETPRCYLCLRPSAGLYLLVLERTSATACSLAERLSGCASNVKLNVSTSDGVCADCLELINTADQHFQQYQQVRDKIEELLRAGSRQRAGPEAESDGEGAEQREGALSPPADGDDSDDSDWAPSGPTPRSTRSRVPKARRRWSPEPIERPTPAPAPNGAPRGRGRPRKHPPVTPTVIDFTDVSALKEQVKDIKTAKFNIKPAPSKRPLKSDLEKIIHLEVRAADSGDPSGLTEEEEGGGRGGPVGAARPHTTGYECRRCDIEFEDSDSMVKHLRQHVNKPWCKRCRTEFPNRPSLLEHRKACRLQHRSGECTICDREVKFYRYHMRQHADLVARGLLEEGAPIPEEDDHPPPSVQKRAGRFLAGGVCSICGEHVPEKLRKHERSHNITHTCPICKKVFTREDVVRGHIKRVHMKERPHVCAQCGKTFVSVYSLQRHEMIHNNEYRFYCQECGDGFRQKQQLTAHMRHKHGVVDVVFEDVQVMPEGAAVVDALSVITEPNGTVYEGAVLEAGEFDKEEYVITAAGDGEDVQFTAVADADGNLHLEG
ncbi:Zinc finger protein 768 [Amphibalanus amphitrite]|uniref:Zinc finger protein 768 n=1 Tax=Amphibalanus amphitrite TaxID=1232801 RepID=A0A6A4V8Q0_AMPAM|nr:Zinc finger protein 768 [Amphibalanus amphitrite]KAF0287029.1 Zinc finger protein 768 [Amphibalanus amphitrite]